MTKKRHSSKKSRYRARHHSYGRPSAGSFAAKARTESLKSYYAPKKSLFPFPRKDLDEWGRPRNVKATHGYHKPQLVYAPESDLAKHLKHRRRSSVH
mgnify:CR=1 FL=1